MSSLCLFAAAPKWMTSWLTPIWLMGVGVLAGLILVLLGYVLFAALSRIPWVAALDDNVRLRRRAILVLALVAYAGMLFLVPWSADPASLIGGAERGFGDVLVTLAMLIPAALAVSFVLVRLSSPNLVAEVPTAIREGVLWPISLAALSLAVFGIVGGLAAEKPFELLSSAKRLPFVGRQPMTFQIPAAPELQEDDALADLPAHPIQLSFLRSELRELALSSEDDLTVMFAPRKPDVLSQPAIEVTAGEPVTWDHRAQRSSPFPDEQVSALYVINRGAEPTTLRMTIVTEPPHPEVAFIGYVAVFTLAVFLLYLLQRAVMPKVSAVALATLKSEIAQPLFLLVLSLGVAFLAISNFIPYHTFGEDIKMLKDSGLTLIMVLCIFQAVWAASTSIAEEIEGRTALTVLSKPIGRRSFIAGKFLGIMWTIALMFLVMGLVFLLVVAFKPIYDSKETAQFMPEWQVSHMQMVSTIPGLALAFMETMVLAALSVAISTRLPLLPNLMICFAIYVLGHLTPLIVQSSVAGFEIVKFVGRLIATVFPILEHFNIQAAVAAGVAVPYEYLAWSLVYCLIYTLIAMFLALAMFEDRDLA